MLLRTRTLPCHVGLAVLLAASAARSGAEDRIGKDVSPAASVPWRAPDLGAYTRGLRSAESSLIDPQKRYELPELVDLAERLNPETRVAWERARQAAIAVGLVQSEYSPILSLNALGGYHSEATPAPQDVAPNGFFRVDLEQARPTLMLEWLLFDFGRRGATSLRAKIAVAQSAVDSARAVREAAESRLQNGLATLPEVALARQQEAQAAFDLEDVQAHERDAQVGLADSIGLPPTTPIQVGDISALPAPAAVEESVEKVIDRAFDQRPDLIARVAALRSKEAEVKAARAAYYPTLALVGDLGILTGRVQITGGNQPTGWLSASEPGYGVGVLLRWNVFNGGATRRRVELAEAEQRAAESEVTAARDRAVSEVWTAYTDVKLAVRRLDTAAALVDASQKSYEATLGSYRQGLETLTNLLVARRELSHALFVELDTRLQLFDASAALAFSTGEAPPRAAGAAIAR